ncbi:MAG: hypothetical protein QMC35_06575 [Polaribacter sp.]|jgi:hypothetical protein
MKNIISIAVLICSITLVSCVPSPPCETPVNGFLTGTSKQMQMGNADAVKVFKQLDIAWAKLDYEKMKTFIADAAYLSFDDGFVATTPQEFIAKIKTEVARTEAAGNNYEWTTNYAFALALTDDGDPETTSDTGDWVNAQFTSKTTNPDSEIDSEVIYEYYHIVDEKVTQWNQFKKTIKK